MRLLKMNGIGKKIILFVSLIIITSLLGISILNYMISKNELSRSNQIILKNAIEATMVEINRNYRYTIGKNQWMSEEDAKIASLASIGDLTSGHIDGISGATEAEVDATSSATANSVYAEHAIDLGESGYFFIVDSKGNIISHPFLEDNIYDLQSSDGRYIIQEIIAVAKSGGGVTNYALDKGISLITDSKTVYSKYFPHWDWIVSAVIYDTELARGSNIILFYNLIGVVVVLAAALFLTMFITNRITKPIKTISDTLQEVSKGDLTVERIQVKSKDETRLLGDSVNRLLDSLSKIVKLMIDSSNRLNDFANDLKHSSGIVSDAAADVAKAISQMAAQSDKQYRLTVDSVEKVTMLGDDIKVTADVSSEIGSVISNNMRLKELGLASVHDLKDANMENNENSAIIENVVYRMNEQAKDISDITTIISHIAKQTNLLALNASIEASRAGEHGKGFAVVADEVRKLAEQSQSSTQLIGDIINSIQKDTEVSAKMMEEVLNNANKGVEITETTSDRFIKIIDNSYHITPQIEKITKTLEQIYSLVENVVAKAKHVTQLAQQNAASSEEVVASTEEQLASMEEINSSAKSLTDLAEDLRDHIDKFRI